MKKKIDESKQQQNANKIDASVSAPTKSGAEVVAGIKLAHIDAYDEVETYKRLLKKRRRRLIGRLFTFLLLLIIAPVMVFLTSLIIDQNGKHNFFGYTYFVVATDSMEPEIMVNDCVILKHVSSEEELKIGDDIGYVNENGLVIVHRIMDIETDSAGRTLYKMKGINTSQYDALKVSFDSVVGKRVATLSVLGNTIVFFRTTGGIITLVVIFASIITAFYFAFRLSENIKYVEQVTKKEQ